MSVKGEHPELYFLGISGVLMSSLACIAKKMGYRVTGSDHHAYPPATTLLESNRIDFFDGYSEANIQSPDMVVLGNHIRKNNVELDAVLSRGLKIISFPELIAQLFSRSKEIIVPAGAHGKSTITSMIGHVLVEAAYDPTVLIGAVSKNLGSSFRIGSDRYLVVEGDEYTSSCLDQTPKFHYYQPSIGIITSIEQDHVDVFDTFEKQFQAYEIFSKTIRKDGLLLLCADSEGVLALNQVREDIRIQTYGLSPGSDWLAYDIAVVDGKSHFKVSRQGEFFEEFALNIPGRHNVQNALAAIAVATNIGIPVPAVKEALDSFAGVGKRFELIGKTEEVVVINDYAHHPTAIEKTLEAVRSQYPQATIWCVYEPHTFTRVKGLLPLYKNVFNAADHAIISDIFAAREESLSNSVHATDILEVCKDSHAEMAYISGKEAILEYLEQNVSPNSVVIFMTVSDFGNTAQRFFEIKNKQGMG